MTSTNSKIVTQGVSLPTEIRDFLRDIAHERKKKGIPKASISSIVLELINSNFETLENELKELKSN